MKKLTLTLLSVTLATSLQATSIPLTSHTPIIKVETTSYNLSECHKTSGDKLVRNKEKGITTKTIDFMDRTGLTGVTTALLSLVPYGGNIILGTVVARPVIREIDTPEYVVQKPTEECTTKQKFVDMQKVVGYNNCGVYNSKTMCVKSTNITYTMNIE